MSTSGLSDFNNDVNFLHLCSAASKFLVTPLVALLVSEAGSVPNEGRTYFLVRGVRTGRAV
jgi:hypothetical protein